MFQTCKCVCHNEMTTFYLSQYLIAKCYKILSLTIVSHILAQLADPY